MSAIEERERINFHKQVHRFGSNLFDLKITKVDRMHQRLKCEVILSTFLTCWKAALFATIFPVNGYKKLYSGYVI